MLKSYLDGYCGLPPSPNIAEQGLRARALGIYHREKHTAPLMTDDAITSRIKYIRDQENDRLSRRY